MLLGCKACKVTLVDQEQLVHQEHQACLEQLVLLDTQVLLEVQDLQAWVEQLDLLELQAETDGLVDQEQLVSLVVLELRVILAVLEQLVEAVLLVSVETLERLDQLEQLAAVEQQVLRVLVDQVVTLDSLDVLDVVEHKEAWDHLEGLVCVEKPVPLAHLEWSAHLAAQALQVHLVRLVELDCQVCRVAQDLRDPSVQLAIPGQLVLLVFLAQLVQVELLVFLVVLECQV